jgi:hypothetical protein
MAGRHQRSKGLYAVSIDGGHELPENRAEVGNGMGHGVIFAQRNGG